MTPTNSTEIERQQEHARRVRQMFAGIAGRYDLLNHLLSGNIDRRWRRIVARRLRPLLTAGVQALDVACGTGDLSLALQEAGAARITGLDFCRPMLEIAAHKTSHDDAPRIPFIEGDALNLPFADGLFDVVTIAFGLRNLADVERGLRELHRVTKPGGTLGILEFSHPVVPGFNALFQFYFACVLPKIGGAISGSRGAYEYLAKSVAPFPDQKRLADMMRAVGFEQVAYQNLTGGIAAFHTGRRLAGSAGILARKLTAGELTNKRG
ncbi:MAG: bifunctional demethylmenaquinone methyltransferase/2-methoxy-6-polyprenyl-1,4-benzoquinol methylase UbiE [Acidobacteriota bacterium]|nr:bifunctional demethylmenaquinone methyltransferase/2-methoxy-6-polyprenyl-1,4-benzoquinol methylase UbiE [Acidobacteriota bacterium]